MKSVYIHIPFCHTICSYCDFPKFYYQKSWMQQYLSHLKKEIEIYYQGEEVKTLYIGGGTPSILNMEELKELFQILQMFRLNQCEEFTFECNIESITKEKAIFLKKNGVNRLSIGIQTFHENYLKLLNRHHQIKEVIEKIKMLKKIGFTNINVDLIYALLNETKKEVKEDLEYFLSLDISHISTYSLMIEPHTMLGISKIKEIDEDLDYEMYELICKTLEKHHFIHYEISNFAKDRYICKHNLVYWNNLEYYGFGLGASGYIDGIRYDNTRNFTKYISGNYRKEEHLLSISEEIENELILGLRKIEGISLDHFYHKYHKNLMEYEIIQKLVTKGNLVIEGGNIKIKKDDIYISNQILCQLIGEMYEPCNK